MAEFKQITIEKLIPDDAKSLSELLSSADPEYSRYFIPFKYDKKTIEKILIRMVKDQYFGLYVGDLLAGFYMLRGFDQGYEIPSYGVWIGPNFSGLGLATLTLHHAFVWCRANGIATLMLKVHPDNTVAKRLYEAEGFRATSTDPGNQNIIYYRTFGSK